WFAELGVVDWFEPVGLVDWPANALMAHANVTLLSSEIFITDSPIYVCPPHGRDGSLQMLQASRQSAPEPLRLRQRFVAELPEPDRDEQDVEKDQPDEQSSSRQVSELRDERTAESLARVHDRVHQHGARQDREFSERLPRIVRAAEEDHRREHQTEHEADVLLAYAAAERQPDRRREQRHEQRQDDEQRDVIAAERD